MLINQKRLLVIIAFSIANSVVAQSPTTRRGGKEIYEEILQSEEKGRSYFDLIFKGLRVDEKEQLAVFIKGTDAISELYDLAKTGDIFARYYSGLLDVHYGLMNLAAARRDPGNSASAVNADKSFKSAIGWIKPLAEQNIPQAQWTYGQLFERGNGVNKSATNALEWWFKAAQTFLKDGERENAMTLFDMMKKTDQNNPQVARLQKLLYPN